MEHSEELQLIEEHYRQSITWAASDEEELAIAQELLEKAQRGFVVDDSGGQLIYASTPDLPVDADYLVDEEALRRERLRRAIPIVGGVLIALLVAAFLVYGRNSASTPEPEPAAMTEERLPLPTQTLTPTATEALLATPTPIPTLTPTLAPTQRPTGPPTVEPPPVVLDPDAVYPVSLEMAGRYFPVVPTTLLDGEWAFVAGPSQACADQSECISWLAGSYVNVVLGLPSSEENQSLISSTLALSDTLVLRTSAGSANVYRLVGRSLVGVYEIEVLRQHQAGLTLVLLGGSSETEADGTDRRLVLHALPIYPGEEVVEPNQD